MNGFSVVLSIVFLAKVVTEPSVKLHLVIRCYNIGKIIQAQTICLIFYRIKIISSSQKLNIQFEAKLEKKMLNVPMDQSLVCAALKKI